MIVDKEALIVALEDEVEGWCGETPETVSVPGVFLADVLQILTEKPRAVRAEQDPEGDGTWVCECGGSLGIMKVFAYCPWCGRKVDWTDGQSESH